MKLSKLYTLLAFVLGFTMFSCSDDEKKKDGPEEELFDVFGIYEGTMNISVVQNDGSKKDFTLDKQYAFVETDPSPNTLRLAVKDFLLEEVEYGNIYIPALYEVKGNTCSLDGFSNHVDLVGQGEAEFTVLGKITEKEISLDIDGKFKNSADKRKIEVTFVGKKTDIKLKNYLFDFEEWEVGNPLDIDNIHFSLPKSKFENLRWSSTDFEVARYKQLELMTEYTVGSSSDNQAGKLSAQIRTVESIEGDNFLHLPKVYGGYLYCGGFNDDTQLHPHDRLLLGSPFEVEPMSVKGYYYYKSGKEYFSCPNPDKPAEVVLDADKVDACLMAAYLYEVSSFENTDDILTLRTLQNSPQVVAKAQYTSEKATRGFEEFEMKLRWNEGAKYDSDKKYRFVLLFASSKDGITYSGAPESVLRIDNVRISTK